LRRQCFNFASCSWLYFASVTFASITFAADRPAAEKLLATGEYATCLEQATIGVTEFRYDEHWWRLKIRAELQLGRYAEARATLEEALKIHRASIVLRSLGHRVYAFNNEPELSAQMFEEIDEKVRGWPSRYSDAESSIVLGRMLLASGADARKVLELFYDRAKKLAPQNPDVLIASAELALDKFAYDLAAKDVLAALEFAPDNADLHYLLAAAFAPSDSTRASAALQKALELNPHHFAARQMLAEQAISGEQYEEAKTQLRKILSVNPHEASAWSLLAVIAHLQGETAEQKSAYKHATEFWRENPAVDSLIGTQLSRKYRFAEGAAFQRRALEKQPDFLPAKLQLAQDLLRLGDPAGWQLAATVNEIDGYNVVMHNLMTLHDRLQSFETIDDGQIIVRMDRREAKLYGDDVVALLRDARATLAEKYEVKIDKPIVVEIFPEQSDFAIRTFGLPGGDGYLGVCFGRVITANSPASRRDSPSNWQAVLWHEFCHAVTLEKTANRMPRWLSEGISVYEERQKNPTWGEHIDPRYRAMLLGEDLTPVSRLSQAFLKPQSGLHLQFAYLESSLVVEYLVDEHGLDVLNQILVDLGAGIPINECLQRYVGSLAGIDVAFTEYAHRRAQEFGAEANWDEPEVKLQSELSEIQAWLEAHPQNYLATEMLALKLIGERRFADAQPLLKELIAWVPQQTGPANAYQLLAITHRELGETEQELAVLNQWVKFDGDAIDAYRPLMKHYRAQSDWESLDRIARLMLAVDPLDESGQAARSLAAEHLGQSEELLRILPRLLLFETTDLAGTHYRLSKLLFEKKSYDESRRHVLLSLEQAPRFREAQNLLLQIQEMRKQPDTPDLPETPEIKDEKPGSPEAATDSLDSLPENSKATPANVEQGTTGPTPEEPTTQEPPATPTTEPATETIE
jgi:tetratricopeptide (TPR) repeat protein